MDVFEKEIFSEFIDMYRSEGLTDEEYGILYQQINSLSYLDEAKPFLYAMRYFGIGTEANPRGVLEELKKNTDKG